MGTDRPRAGREARRHLRAGRRAEPEGRPSGPLRAGRTGSRRSSATGSGAPHATPTSARRAACSPRRCFPGRSLPRPTCLTSPGWSRCSTSSRSRSRSGSSRRSRGASRVQSIEFNRRFLATVPADHDPVALRELFSLHSSIGSQGSTTRSTSGSPIASSTSCGVSTSARADEYGSALDNAGRLFSKLRDEMEEHGLHTYPAGPWHAGLERFPDESA